MADRRSYGVRKDDLWSVRLDDMGAPSPGFSQEIERSSRRSLLLREDARLHDGRGSGVPLELVRCERALMQGEGANVTVPIRTAGSGVSEQQPSTERRAAGYEWAVEEEPAVSPVHVEVRLFRGHRHGEVPCSFEWSDDIGILFRISGGVAAAAA